MAQHDKSWLNYDIAFRKEAAASGSRMHLTSTIFTPDLWRPLQLLQAPQLPLPGH